MRNLLRNSLDRPAADPRLWLLDRKITFLNHGSFGSCPRQVLDFQQAMRNRLERRPVEFLVRDLEPLLDDARSELARFLKADADDLVLVANATTGVNSVLRSLQFKRGDELLVADHEYNASRNALNFVAERAGARVVVARVPFFLRSPDQIVDAYLHEITPRTRLALLDHVTSQTGLVFPVERLIQEFSRRGIDTLVDGAHAPGMIPLNLKKLGATYYTGNCHKWLCAPKTAGFLHVQPDKQSAIRPLVISHGANSRRTDRSRFLVEFGWTGTNDPSASLSVPEAMRYVAKLLPGGWPEVMRRNHALAVAARKIICAALEIELPCPDAMLGSMAAVPIPDVPCKATPKSPLFLDRLQDELLLDYSIEVPVIPWPGFPKRLLRISAQLYNSLPQYERLAKILGHIPWKPPE
ncbi:MAG: aminotransferase class V-fold PLP-dependent enzyme [Verrucomicrobiota bacterium]